MELFIGIPFGIVGALIWIAGYSDRLRDDPALVPVLAWCIVFPLVWGFGTFLFIVHPALLLVFPAVILAALGIRRYLKTRTARDEPMPLLDHYTELKRQDAAQAVSDWNAQAEELLMAAGVECDCQETVEVYYTYGGGHTFTTHRQLSPDCPLHAWRGLELAKALKH